MKRKQQCICVFEPRGEHGLEGYQYGDTYEFITILRPPKHPLIRVFPVKGEDYSELCTRRAFLKFFKELK